MIWKIYYTSQARQDLRDIYEYISRQLMAPETASKQIEVLMNAVRSLESMPKRHKIYDEEPWKSRELRFMPVKNYLVFYLEDEKDNAVKIIRMYKGKFILAD